jgi:ectoine hydroxylase-related dioxygenase (phytanoyl-CoA dioxygenase family)
VPLSSLFSRPKPTTFSRYGGLWIDLTDFNEAVTKRQKKGQLTREEADQVRFFADKGYLVIEQAVDAAACDRFSQDITSAFERGDNRLLIQRPGEGQGKPLTPDQPRVQARVVDSYVYYESALELLLSDKITRFLQIIFEDAPLLFQSLSFYNGSEQGMHQDTAYVVVSSPLELSASWIALEDVQEGSGELMYIPGSHRLPEYHFSGKYKHWAPDRDGAEQHNEWARMLREEAEQRGYPVEIFRPKKGDALIWAADLVHGGSPVKDRSRTRKSLVGHYCPNCIDPHYFSYAPGQRTKGHHRNGYYSSSYYAIAQAATA